MIYAKIISVVSLIALCATPFLYWNGYTTNPHEGTIEFGPLMYVLFVAFGMQIPAFVANVILHRFEEGKWKHYAEIYSVLLIFGFLFLGKMLISGDKLF